MNDLAAARAAYNRDAVLSASPARLLTMLYDRLLLDLHRAEAAQGAQNWTVAAQNLLHAQDIVAELTSSLKPDLWEGGPNLLALYQFVSRSLVSANVYKDPARTRECIALLEPLRAAWHEAAAETPAPAYQGLGQVLA
ncbi:flagellar export chaperone FliS [Naasia sp. SYSU D00948]|uniref:flagellar export chaperone FliS n=1 Tax=Naasia sp. SYSU D00948 TaxID=2817379 RepID=UPI001B30AF79|nr:flagellar export chaperone FliS [Naasia sp. SYSU D00948]